MHTTHWNVGLKCYFFILQQCLFIIIVIYAYFIDISQGSERCIYSVVGCVKLCYCKLSAECASERILKIDQ